MPSSPRSRQRRPRSSDLSHWFHRAKEHEEGALQQLLALYRPLLMKLANQRVKGAMRAKIGASDLVQTTTWKATQNFSSQTFKERKNFLAWLCEILKNEATDAFRRFREAEKRDILREQRLFSAKTTLALSRLSARLSVDGAEFAAGGISIATLLDVLERLPPHYQLVLNLRYHEGLTWDAIGARLERSADAARVFHNRVLRKVRSELDRAADKDRSDEDKG